MGESLLAFTLDLQRLQRQVDPHMSDKEKIDIFLEGINKTLRVALLTVEESWKDDYAKLIASAKKLEQYSPLG